MRKLTGMAAAIAMAATMALAGQAVAQQYLAPDPGGNEKANVPIPPKNKLFGLNEIIFGGAFGQSPVTYGTLTAYAGGNAIRSQIDWRIAEPVRDEWNEDAFAEWTYAYDTVSQLGLRPIFIIGLAPTWARDPVGQECTGLHLQCRFPPARGMYDEWAEFVGEIVRRYPYAILQIWNEPNLHSWFGGEADPERYAELLHHAYTTVKAINPDVPVIGGGLANNQDGNGAMPLREFLERAYGAPHSIRNSMDYLGINMFPYAMRFGANSLIAKSFKDVRDTQDTAGDDTKILITETGISSGKPSPFTEAQQARGSLRIYRRMMSMPDVAGVIFHRIIEPGNAVAAPIEPGFAWLRFNTEPLEPKPVYCMFAERAGNFYPPCLALKVKGPKGKTKARKRLRFRFSARSLDAKFRCSLDRRKLKRCAPRKAFKRVRRGRHVLRVRAVDRNGNKSPVVKRKFRVVPKKKGKKRR